MHYLSPATAIKYYAAHPIVQAEVQNTNTVEVLFRQTELRGAIGWLPKNGINGLTIKSTLFQ
jgi:DNA-binding transcriptional LysR family regulator